MSIKQISLAYREGSSDKVYHIQIEQSGSNYVVNFQYGRRGSTLSSGSKTSSPVSLAEATKVFDKLAREKMAKGYTESSSGTPFVATDKAERVSGVLPQLLNPIDDVELQEKLNDGSWMQQKHDGRRCLVHRSGDKVEGINRKGLTIGLPKPVADFAKAVHDDFVIDGELVGDVLYAFDILELNTHDVRENPYSLRLGQLADVLKTGLGGFTGRGIQLVVTAKNREDKKELFNDLKEHNAEGAVFKDPTARYKVGRPSTGGDQLKYKFYATASCIVTKVNAKRSVALGLYDSNASGSRVVDANGTIKTHPGLVDVGNVTIPPSSPVPKPGDKIECRYLYARRGGSLYQPTFLGVRDDIDASACNLSQLKYKAENAEDDDA